MNPGGGGGGEWWGRRGRKKALLAGLEGSRQLACWQVVAEGGGKAGSRRQAGRQAGSGRTILGRCAVGVGVCVCAVWVGGQVCHAGVGCGGASVWGR